MDDLRAALNRTLSHRKGAVATTERRERATRRASLLVVAAALVAAATLWMARTSSRTRWSGERPERAFTTQRDAGADRSADVPQAQRRHVVDSILPLEEELRRFRQGLPRAQALRGGARDLGTLVRAVVQGLAAHDTATLRRLTLSRAEFAWLVYPTSPYVTPPYRQAPWLVWFQISMASEKGMARLLARAGGWRVEALGHACEPKPERQGLNRIWRRCVVHLRSPSGRVETQRLFGDVIERGGQFKIVSFANDL